MGDRQIDGKKFLVFHVNFRLLCIYWKGEKEGGREGGREGPASSSSEADEGGGQMCDDCSAMVDAEAEFALCVKHSGGQPRYPEVQRDKMPRA
jgi:hypothetical protein